MLGGLLGLGLGATSADAQLGILDFSLINGDSAERLGHAVASGDFDGDRFDDLAVGRPETTVDGLARVGEVTVFYGGFGGWSAIETLDPGAFGEAPASGMDFGWSLVSGDFDADGRDDLVIGAPGEDVLGSSGAGTVYVIYGGVSGLDLGNVQSFDQEDLGTVAESGDRFGSSLASGDLSGDGADDLAIGVHLENLQTSTNQIFEAGAVNVIYGASGAGLSTAGTQYLHENSDGISLNANANGHFGRALAIGQFLAGGVDDLAVGAPGEVVSGGLREGVVVILRGQPGGLDPVGTEEFVFSQSTDNLLGTGQDGDEFGFALEVGDFNGDGSPDLAIGSPGESELGTTESGAVHVLYGFGSIGISVLGQFLVESSFDTDVDAFDRLGESLTAGDFNADGRDDLAIGAPLDNSLGFANAGEVDVLYGTRNGLVIAGGQVFNMIFFDTLEVGDEFGFALAAGHFFRPSATGVDLAVGVPLRGGPAGDEPGAAVVIRTRAIFAGDFETGDVARWSNTVP